MLDYCKSMLSVMTLNEAIEEDALISKGCVLLDKLNREHQFSMVTCEHGTYNCILSTDTNGWEDIVVDTTDESILPSIVTALYDVLPIFI